MPLDVAYSLFFRRVIHTWLTIDEQATSTVYQDSIPNIELLCRLHACGQQHNIMTDLALRSGNGHGLGQIDLGNGQVKTSTILYLQLFDVTAGC